MLWKREYYVMIYFDICVLATLYYRNFKTRIDVERYLSIDLPYLYKIDFFKL